MIVLGIDPGYERLGLAVVEYKENKTSLIYSTCFQTSAKIPFVERLFLIGQEIKNTIETYKPDKLSTEKLFFTTNQKTAMNVSEVKGVISYEALRNNLIFEEYTPLQIKMAITGNGKSDKKQITKMIPLLVPVYKEIKHDDEYDAIAIALTSLAYKNRV